MTTDTICDGVPAVRLKDRMIALEDRQRELEDKLATTTEDQVLIYPNMVKVYRAQVEHLATALNEERARSEAVGILRSLIDRVVVTPDLATDAPCISLEGNLAGILSLAQTAKNAAPVSPEDASQIKLVAGVGFEPTTFRL